MRYVGFHLLCFTLLLAGAQADGEGLDFVRLGAGSYAARPPAGGHAPPTAIYRTPASSRAHPPAPTNDWWSSLAWMKYSERQYPHPLAVQAEARGLRVHYPGPGMTANRDAIFAFMPPGGSDDLVVGHSKLEKSPEAREDGFSDWFVRVRFAAEDGRGMTLSYGHGSPFVYGRIQGGGLAVSFARTPKLWSGSASDPTLGITINGRHYGLFAPAGSTWSGLTSKRWVNDPGGRDYFSIAVLPDASPTTLARFHAYAHNHVTDTRVDWRFDQQTSSVITSFKYTTQRFEGKAEGTLYALYPHQWTRTADKLTAWRYASVRGEMRVGEGTGFSTRTRFPGVLPLLPPPEAETRDAVAALVAKEVPRASPPVRDTYWLGKQLGRLAVLGTIAEQCGQLEAARTTQAHLRQSLEQFLAAADGGGKLKRTGLFAYEKTWGTLIGYPASFGSDTEINDHHFHYGYFIRAAAEIARRDPAWAADDRYGLMVKLLIRDIASPDRTDNLFPFLRCFDPYAGHSWASGHGRFGDGNNNESSSEAMNAWYGIILWGAATGDRDLRDLGIYLFATELAAIEDYWFDVTNRFHHPDFTPSVVTMIWGGKGANATWFSNNPEMVHGINWLPIHAGSLYLGRYPTYVQKNYGALVQENKGSDWDEWADLVWMYRALVDPDDARAQFERSSRTAKRESGNSLANTLHWIQTLGALGTVDREITADHPFYAVFNRGGRRTHVAFNMSDAPVLVRFSDGTELRCAPRSLARDP
ncbi:MAG: glycosyl hydrolase [Phycisphaerae bacterium]|nr:glycosyl hydrolase [Phycisphaerae bacterium]